VLECFIKIVEKMEIIKPAVYIILLYCCNGWPGLSRTTPLNAVLPGNRFIPQRVRVGYLQQQLKLLENMTGGVI
jgi:hypothetical protein